MNKSKTCHLSTSPYWDVQQSPTVLNLSNHSPTVPHVIAEAEESQVLNYWQKATPKWAYLGTINRGYFGPRRATLAQPKYKDLSSNVGKTISNFA